MDVERPDPGSERRVRLLYGGVAGASLLTVLVGGLLDRDLAGRITGEGGPYAIASVLAWGATVVCASRAAWRRRGIRRLAWTGVAALSVVAAGEEVDWSLRGLVDPWGRRATLHNGIAPFLDARLDPETVVALLYAGVAIVLAMLLAGERLRRRMRVDDPDRGPAAYLLVCAAALTVGFALDATGEVAAEIAYVPGQGPLEETLELVGAVGGLIAAWTASRSRTRSRTRERPGTGAGPFGDSGSREAYFSSSTTS